MIDNIKIITEFNRIKQMGFIKSNRKHYTGIGKTFEDHLGVKENNIKDTDFDGFEVKTQRFLAGSKITLFTKSFSYPPKSNTILRQKYGYPDDRYPQHNILHTSLFANRYNNLHNNIGFKLQVNNSKKKILLLIKDLKTNKRYKENIFYSYDDLMDSTKKLNKLIVVTAESKTIRNNEYFHFTNASIFLGFSFSKFIQFIQEGVIQFDIRIGIYRSGKNFGETHDHGNGFRIHRNRIGELFEEIIIL